MLSNFFTNFLEDLLNESIDLDIVGTNDTDVIDGTLLDDLILGLDGGDEIDGRLGRDAIIGGEGGDILEGGRGRDKFGYSDGEGGDIILDFSIRQDSFVLDAESFGFDGAALNFQNVARTADDDVEAGLVGLDTDSNLYVLQGIWNNAGQAATAVVDAGENDDFFFVYYNVNLDVNRLFFFDQEAANAGDAFSAAAGIQQLANLGENPNLQDGVNDEGAVEDLAEFDADNFSFDFDGLFT
ncbi:MAG: hypothetical protein ACFBRM_09270 [Pikeienuella sp.]